MNVIYDSRKVEYKDPFGCVIQGQPCTIRIHISKDVSPQNVYLCVDEDNAPICDYKMEWEGDNETHNIFKCIVSMSRCGLYFYYFKVRANSTEYRVYNEDNQASIGSGGRWQVSYYSPEMYISPSFQGKVMYQIFPDRFHQVGECDTTEKLKPFSLHKRMYDIPLYLPDINGEVQNNDFYGGNLKGIQAKLSYLKELKVGIIYLNPVFMAYSNHRYDTADYKRIDPLLGTKQDFADLCAAAHRMGMKIVLDGVFSHTGSRSTYFDIDNHFGGGAYHDPESPYRSWFQFQHYPDTYTSWWGITTLPCTNEMDPAFVNYIIDDEDSVVAHWMNLGADGFRLDVADELPDEFIERLHSRVHRLNPEGIVIGEVWEDASNKVSYSVRRKYFTKLELDSVMNYPFKDAIIGFVRGSVPAKALTNTVMGIAENYPKPVLHTLMNSLSTHDTVRIVNALYNTDERMTKSQRGLHWMRQHELIRCLILERCAAFLQYMLPGSPCIYYGDEIGMQGFEDPFNRRYFQWDNINEDMLSFYKQLGKLKKSNDALSKGDVWCETLGERTVKLTRKYDNTTLVAIASVDEFTTELTNGRVIFINRGKLDRKELTLKKYGFVLYEEGASYNGIKTDLA